MGIKQIIILNEQLVSSDTIIDTVGIYKYDENQRLIYLNEYERTRTFTYNANGQLTQEVYTNESYPENNYTSTFSYDSKGNLIKIEDSDNNKAMFSYHGNQITMEYSGFYTADEDDYASPLFQKKSMGERKKTTIAKTAQIPFKYKHIYTISNGVITQMESNEAVNNEPYTDSNYGKTEISWINGNVSKYISTTLSFHSEKNFQYDNKINLFRLTSHPIIYWLDYQISKNNPTKVTYSAVENNEPYSYQRDFEYEYNAEGLPTKIITKYSDTYSETQKVIYIK